jgi:hypothetical protein
MTAPRLIGATNPSGVTLTPTALQISHLLVDDPEVLHAARRAQAAGEPLEAWLIGLMRAGAVALAAVTSSRDLSELSETVRRTGVQIDEVVRRSSEQLSAMVRQAVDPDQGPMAVATRSQIDRLSEGVARLVTGSDAVLPSSVRASVAGVTSEVLAEIQRALGNTVMQVQQAVSQDRPILGQGLQQLLTQHSTTVTQQLTELREQVTVAAAPRPRTSAAIGADHEAQVVQELCRLAQGAGDLCSGTGTVTGNDGSKVGDAVVELANPAGGSPLGRLVVEAKDRSAPLSSAKLLEELRAARSNRGAHAGLIVCASVEMLPGKQSLVILSDRDMAVAWTEGDSPDILRAAVLLLKLGVARGSHGSASTVDLPELRRSAARAVQHLTGFDRLERLAGSTSKSLKQVVDQATLLRSQLVEELDALSTGLSAGLTAT